MKITKGILDAQVDMINSYTGRGDGEKYYVGYENGHVYLFLEYGSGRKTISWAETKRELSKQLNAIIAVFLSEQK